MGVFFFKINVVEAKIPRLFLNYARSISDGLVGMVIAMVF